MDRRQFLFHSAAATLIAPLLPGMALGQTEIEAEQLRSAAGLAGLDFSEEEMALMMGSVREQLDSLQSIVALGLPNSLPPAIGFDPRLPGRPAMSSASVTWHADPATFKGARPQVLEWATIQDLTGALRERKLRAVDLLEHCLRRYEAVGEKLEAVITLTADRAREQAARADKELDAGQWRGPLHGIPWAAKDILTVEGYPTTWGAVPFRDQILEGDAEVVRRLDEAGAILFAKSTVGALAWGDVWFGGKTRNPWNLEQGSSGSSAGSASLVAAGIVPFAIGTETLGSIVSPSARCGASGLRPTFGRVSRRGCMALSWTMDKIGPIARTMEDCLLVLRAIHGADPGDPDSRSAPLGVARPATELRLGFDEEAFTAPREGREEEKALDDAVLEEMRRLGHRPRPIALPELPVGDMLVILSAEAAAAFDQLTRSDRDDELTRQVEQAWPNVFRAAQMLPAVQYIQAQRARRQLMVAMQEAMAGVDAYLTPSFSGRSLLVTNLTGQPCAVMPNGFRADGTPTSISFIGQIDGEAEMVKFASHWQASQDWHRRHPSL